MTGPVLGATTLARLFAYRCAVEEGRPHRETWNLLVEYANGITQEELEHTQVTKGRCIWFR